MLSTIRAAATMPPLFALPPPLAGSSCPWALEKTETGGLQEGSLLQASVIER